MTRTTYLAENYMSGPKADAILARTSHKAKKRKTEPNTTSTLSYKFVDDDDGGWGADKDDDGDDADEAVVATDRSFKKKAAIGTAGWATVREGEAPSSAGDEKPQIVEDSSCSRTSFLAGLLTAAQLKKSLSRKESYTTETEAQRDAARLARETIYRDASGRKIDTKAERAESARKKREAEAREAKKMQWGKGLVQREEEERQRVQLERERDRTLAVYADDRDLNEEQKAKDRWNDPAAAFLTKKREKGPRKPEYTGPTSPPNRFAIKPGYRWDGVDRGNGFEKKLFQKTNERKRKGLESYQWSVGDM